MTEHELFDRLPDQFFKGLKEQMILGMTPSKLVAEILKPLLTSHAAALAQLPPGLRNDIEDILRIYPEIAERYGLEPAPSLTYVLERIRQHFRKLFQSAPTDEDTEAPAMTGAEEDGLLFAQEPQKPFGKPASGIPREGKSYFPIEEGRSILLELRYVEGDCLLFESPGLTDSIHIYLSGRHALTLHPEQKEPACLPLDRFMSLCRSAESSDVEIEIRKDQQP